MKKFQYIIILIVVLFVDSKTALSQFTVKVRVDEVYSDVFENFGAVPRNRWNFKIGINGGAVGERLGCIEIRDSDRNKWWREDKIIYDQSFPYSVDEISVEMNAFEDEDNDFDCRSHGNERFETTGSQIFKLNFAAGGWVQQGIIMGENGRFAAKVSILYTIPSLAFPTFRNDEGYESGFFCQGKTINLAVAPSGYPGFEYEWEYYYNGDDDVSSYYYKTYSETCNGTFIRESNCGDINVMCEQCNEQQTRTPRWFSIVSDNNSNTSSFTSAFKGSFDRIHFRVRLRNINTGQLGPPSNSINSARVLPAPEISMSSSDVTFLKGDPNPNVSMFNALPAGGTWTGAGLSTDGTIDLSTLAEQEHIYTYTVKSASCESVRAVKLILKSNPTPPKGGYLSHSYSNVSCGSASGSLTIQDNAGDKIQWYYKTSSTDWTPFDNSGNTYAFSVPEQTQFKVVGASVGYPEESSNVVTVFTSSYGGGVSGGGAGCVSATGLLQLSGEIGTVVRWEKREGTNAAWTTVLNEDNIVHIEKTLGIENLSVDTEYRAVVKLGDCIEATSSIASILVNPMTDPGIAIEQNVLCTITEGNVVTLSGEFQLQGYVDRIIRWEKYDGEEEQWMPVPPSEYKDYSDNKTIVFNTNKKILYRALVQSGGCDALYSGVAAVVVNKPYLGEKNVTHLNLGEYGGYSYKMEESIILGKGFEFKANDCQEFSIEINPNGSHPSDDMNYVAEQVITKEGVKDEEDIAFLDEFSKRTKYTYMDGMGRPVQEVIQKGSADRRDLIKVIEYDAAGRQDKVYLPYVAESTFGGYRTNYLAEVTDFYKTPSGPDLDKIANTDFPYAITKYEPSPLGRVQKQGFAGEVWQPNNNPLEDHSLKYHYKVNTETDIRYWEISNSGLPVSPRSYAARELLITITQDEENLEVREYKEGSKLILKRIVGDGETLDTYYVYDLAGNLKYVFSPEAVDNLPGDFAPSDDFLKTWAFSYQYDEKGRMDGKRVPGTDWVYTIYDNWDRPVLSQDGNQRDKNEWTFTKYDIKNRPICNGIIYINPGISVKAAVTSSSNPRYENKASNSIGYTLNQTYPTVTESELLTITYYDDYNFLEEEPWDDKYLFVPELGNSDYNKKVIGTTTGSRVRILGENSAGWINTISYLDYKYRTSQVTSSNILNGADRVSSSYSFADNLQETKRTLVEYGNTTVSSISQNFDYDHSGRPKVQYHQINNRARVQLSEKKYNPLGELVEKDLHSVVSGYLQSIDYRYNIRGWMTQINKASLTQDGGLINDDGNDLFGMDLRFNSNHQVENSKAWYNANISEIIWASKESTKISAYQYDYDAYNRLKAGRYEAKLKTGASWLAEEKGKYNELITKYDKNGNIENLSRNGFYNDQIEGIDVLTYDYAGSGNQLKALRDEGTINGFSHTDVNDSPEYEYDKNGNLTSDKNNKITKIEYNYINLPTKIIFQGGDWISYTYSATGEKLRKNDSKNDKVEYFGDIIYNKNELELIITSEGYVDKAFSYKYYLKDHLGSNRIVFQQKAGTTEAEIVDEEHFYPFGMTMNNIGKDGSGNRYKYQGQEFQENFGLDLYQFQLRMYDPILGRWLSTDPYDQYSSPYIGMGNNPVSLIDPDGGKTNDDVFYSSGTNQATVIPTNDAFDRMYYDGSFLGYSAQGIGASTFQDKRDYGSLSTHEIGFFESWQRSDNFIDQFFYGIADGAYLTAQMGYRSPTERMHLGGGGATPRELVTGFASTATLFLPTPKGTQAARATGLIDDAAKASTGLADDAIRLTTSSKSLAPSRTYTIFDGSGQLYKFGVTDANLLRYNQSLLQAGPGAYGKFSSIMPKNQAHIMEKYLRSLHYNSTGQYALPGMKIPYPVNFNTGLPIKR